MKALIITADNFDDPQLLVPLYWLQDEGLKIEIASIQEGIVRGLRGHEVEVYKTIHEVKPDDYSILLLPGGEMPGPFPKKLLDITRCFIEKDKVVAASCEALRILIAAGALKGRRTVCHKSIIITEILGAGALCEDKNVVVDGKLVTCRCRADLPAFSRAIIELVEKERWYYTIEDVLAPCLN